MAIEVGHILYLRGYFLATSFIDNKIYRITPEGEVLQFAGTGERGERDGPVAEAIFSNPNGIAADPTGTFIYINDYVGDPNAPLPLGSTPFSLRRIELPRLGKILAHELETGSLQTAEAAYHRYRNDPANAGEITENEISALGISYFRKGENDTALLLFKLNADDYPDSFIAWNNLGAAYMETGDRAHAIEALEKSLSLNPDNARAKMRLEKLQRDG
ncbi:MAG: tetratricopeptide repeat protein [Acidobacteriota bacterium]